MTTRKNFIQVLEKTLARFQKQGISLSLESHISPQYFVFDGLEDYAQFVAQYPELGVLIDISHNTYDGYSEDQIIQLLSPLRVTGLHISDTLAHEEFRKGTHLPIGKGEVEFEKIIHHFQDRPNLYGALEIKGTSEEIAQSSAILQEMIRK